MKRIKTDNIPLIVFGVIITVFSLVFLRLFIKTDDGNFLGIVASPDFAYSEWLVQRYNTVSGRTVGEFLLAFFLRHNIVFWKLANSAVIIYIVYFWCRLSECFNGEYTLYERRLFCCCALFMMLVSCLNPGAFWFAGSFSYLWPFAGILLTVSPLVFYLFNIKLSRAEVVISCVSALIGTMQEQSAACCTAIYVILIVLIARKKLKLKPLMLIPLIIILMSDYLLLSSPGISGRIEMEAKSGFGRYSDFNVLQKLSCGLSVFFANSFYLSFFLIIVFVFLLCEMISCKTHKKRYTNLLRVARAAACVVCVVLNLIVSLSENALPHMIFRKAFLNGEFGIGFYVLFCFGCILSIIILIMLIVLIVYDKAMGTAVGLCAAAGFFSAIAISFSPTVFASGQRVAFYTNMFVITACVIMISSVRKSKITERIYKASVVYACISFAVECIAFSVAEIPLMG